jgi:hypothetical protein
MMKTTSSLMFASLLMLATFSVGSLAKKTVFAAEEGAERVALRTVYLQKPIKEFHQIKLEGDLKGKGRLSLDPNTCTVTEFGETSGCTRIAITNRDVTFKLVRTEGGRRLFSIEGADLGNPLYLVAPASNRGSFRLVYNDRGSATPYPVSMENINE